MDLDEARVVQQRPRRGDRRVEALRVPDAERDVRVGRRLDQLVGFEQRSRDRFFDEHGDAGAKKRQRDVAVQLGRHRDGHRLDLADQPERGARRPRPGRHRIARAHAVGIDDGNQLDTRQWRQDPRVVLPRWPTPMTATRRT